eukprot:m51a1_g1015 hypothetical protein (203) ;mRNA; r:617938-621680
MALLLLHCKLLDRRCKCGVWSVWTTQTSDGNKRASPVVVVCDPRWMHEHRLGCDAIKAACAAAAVRLEGAERGPDLGPCARCCARLPRALVTIGGPAVEEALETDGGRRLVDGNKRASPVVVVCDPRWMHEHRLGCDAIKAACAAAAVRLEGAERGPDLGPCARCCARLPRALVTIGGPAVEEALETDGGRRLVYAFHRCKS